MMQTEFRRITKDCGICKKGVDCKGQYTGEGAINVNTGNGYDRI